MPEINKMILSVHIISTPTIQHLLYLSHSHSFVCTNTLLVYENNIPADSVDLVPEQKCTNPVKCVGRTVHLVNSDDRLCEDTCDANKD